MTTPERSDKDRSEKSSANIVKRLRDLHLISCAADMKDSNNETLPSVAADRIEELERKLAAKSQVADLEYSKAPSGAQQLSAPLPECGFSRDGVLEEAAQNLDNFQAHVDDDWLHQRKTDSGPAACAIWTPFRTQMPSARDASRQGRIELLEQNGSMREGAWNWTDSAESWLSNGFTAWRRIQ